MSEIADRFAVYTAAAPSVPNSADLRARIPGWGVDLDHRDRPAFPQESREPTGAHWDYPDEQEDLRQRERSIEHERLPPVFGTSVPLRGLSGMIRRFAYCRFSEARSAHWLLLLASDRVDAAESHLTAWFSGHPDKPIDESGMDGQSRSGPRSDSAHRADSKHYWMDPIIVLGPWVGAAAAALLITTAMIGRYRRCPASHRQPRDP